MVNKIAKFNIGDVVFHTRQGYRAIVVDVDPIFQASGRYNPQACKRAFAHRNPWYRLLVDNSSQVTYVEECKLQGDSNPHPINNPKINGYLVKRHGCYHRNASCH